MISSVTGSATPKAAASDRESELKKVFREFTAGTFYREMLAAMRKSQGKPAYFDGGQAEKIFRAELDRHIAADLTERHGDAFAEPLYKNFAQQVLSGPRA